MSNQQNIDSPYKLIYDDNQNFLNYPKKSNIFLFDPPYKPKNTPYHQIRKDNDINLKEIETPIDYEGWFETIVVYADWTLEKDGWFIFKSDDYTAREIYPIITKYFNYCYTIIWDKGMIGLGNKFRKRHEIFEVYHRKDETPYWNPRVNKKKKENFHGDSRGLAFPSIIKVLKEYNGTFGKCEKDVHINQSPQQIWDWFLEFCVPDDGLIVDPCMGSGSILKSMLYLNHKLKKNMDYWGIEIDKEYEQQLKQKLNSNILQYLVE